MNKTVKYLFSNVENVIGAVLIFLMIVFLSVQGNFSLRIPQSYYLDRGTGKNGVYTLSFLGLCRCMA